MNNLNVKISENKNIYNIRLFSIKLNSFFKHFEFLTLEEKKTELTKLQNEYIEYINNLNELDDGKILSFYNYIN